MSGKNEIVSYKWPIQNIAQTLKEELSLRSPKFVNPDDPDKAKWRLILTRPREGDKNGISLYLQSIEHYYAFCSPMLKVKLSIIQPVEGTVIKRIKIIFDVHEKQLYGFENFISLKELDSYNFTIKCEIEEVNEDFVNSKLLFKHDDSCDINLLFEGECYPVHKFVIAASSLHFRKLFGLPELTSDVEINDLEHDVFLDLLNYMYNGEISSLERDDKEIINLFEASAKYKICNLMRICKEVLIANLTIENVIPTLLASRVQFESNIYVPVFDDVLGELTDDSKLFIRNNFEAVMKLDLCKELLEKEPRLLIDVLGEILINKDLNCEQKISAEKGVHASLPFSWKNFKRFVNSDRFSDVEIYVEDQKYYAHKVFLAGNSPVFDRMLSLPMKETLTGIVEIEDLKSEVFEEMLRFIYTNEFDAKDDDLLKEMLVAADKYEIDDLKSNCEDILAERLSVENVVDVLKLAEDHNAASLKKIGIDFIIGNDTTCSNFLHIKTCHMRHLASIHPHILLDMVHQVYKNSS